MAAIPGNLLCLKMACYKIFVAHTKLDVQYFRPAIVYLNGEYWGIHNIRDRYDEWYLYYTYGVDPKQVEMIKDSVVENEGSTPLADPSRANYRRILQLIDPNYRQNGYQTVNTLSNPQAYQQLQQLMSVDNFWIMPLFRSIFKTLTGLATMLGTGG